METKSKCNYKNKVLAFYDNILKGKEKKNVIKHLETCPDCQVLLEDLHYTGKMWALDEDMHNPLLIIKNGITKIFKGFKAGKLQPVMLRGENSELDSVYYENEVVIVYHNSDSQNSFIFEWKVHDCEYRIENQGQILMAGNTADNKRVTLKNVVKGNYKLFISDQTINICFD